MSNKQKKLFFAVLGTILLCMLICGIFGWEDPGHSRVWRDAREGFNLLLVLVILFFMFRFPGNRAVPDTLTRLFPKPTQESPEAPKQ